MSPLSWVRHKGLRAGAKRKVPPPPRENALVVVESVYQTNRYVLPASLSSEVRTLPVTPDTDSLAPCFRSHRQNAPLVKRYNQKVFPQPCGLLSPCSPLPVVPETDTQAYRFRSRRPNAPTSRKHSGVVSLSQNTLARCANQWKLCNPSHWVFRTITVGSVRNHCLLRDGRVTSHLG